MSCQKMEKDWKGYFVNLHWHLSICFQIYTEVTCKQVIQIQTCLNKPLCAHTCVHMYTYHWIYIQINSIQDK